MPYEKNEDLPDQVRENLPRRAQTIYREAFNSAFDQYDSSKDRRGSSSREKTAHRVAWNAVKEKYAKDDNDEWKRKRDE
ncbi:MAG: ChaB family protein [Wenzhouxiangellaceae bacterium]|jgi:cation transport regulator|nr:ChaB family protein [Wenzhouxiangellaceae bacterium]MBS3746449.1 ChaB family protein [Wenzhouxiangellaceae bacterium]MBS3823182.1 ChaB family protein [Wenzhouxiangellaceae bacterium]